MGAFSCSLLLKPVELRSVGFNGLHGTVLRTSVSWLVTSLRVSVVVELVTLRFSPDADRFSCSVGEMAAEAGRLFFWRSKADVLRSARLPARDGGSEAIAIDRRPFTPAKPERQPFDHLLIADEVHWQRARGKDTRAATALSYLSFASSDDPEQLILA